MRKRAAVALLLGLAVAGLAWAFVRSVGPDAKDLSHWLEVAQGKDWSVQAAENDPKAQFYHGLNLIRAGILTTTEGIPLLSDLPGLGKLLFTKTTYCVSPNDSSEQKWEAYRWIKKSADQGYSPAIETEKMFWIGMRVRGEPD